MDADSSELGSAGCGTLASVGHLTFIGEELRNAVSEELANWAVKFPPKEPPPILVSIYPTSALLVVPTIESFRSDLQRLRKQFEILVPRNEQGELDLLPFGQMKSFMY